LRVLIGTRGSALALWQTRFVGARLSAIHQGITIEHAIIQTTGDRITDVPLARIGDTGLFTRQLDRALLAGDVDLAVHSLKDVPTRLPSGLRLAAVLERDDPRDALVPAPGGPGRLEDIPARAVIGTSSLRRRALLARLRPDLQVEDLRGNLDTRIRRLSDGHFAAAILAYAGIRRLGRADVVGEVLDPPAWLPAPGQGALAVVSRDEDDDVTSAAAALDHRATRAAVTAERALLRTLEGGCQVPIGALATGEERLVLHAFAADDDGSGFVAASLDGPAAEAAGLGERLAARMIAEGAGVVLERLRRRAAGSGPFVPPPAAP
jgi:hydroxymethylbilane synthase